MKHINYYREYIINEVLGFNKDVSDFSKMLLLFIETDLHKNVKSNIIKPTNKLGINSIELNYTNKPNQVSSISTNGSDIILNINTTIADSDLLQVINHELLHAYSEIKGYNKEDDYKQLIKLSNIYDANTGYTGRLIYILYFFSGTKINSNIQELFIEIKNSNIKNKADFNKYITSHQYFSNIKYMEKLDLQNIWNKIVIEKTDDFLIKTLNIKDVSSWIKKKEKYLKHQAEDFKRRIFRMSEIFDRNF